MRIKEVKNVEKKPNQRKRRTRNKTEKNPKRMYLNKFSKALRVMLTNQITTLKLWRMNNLMSF